jgi:5'(3')-deoxyribonucleotidase
MKSCEAKILKMVKIFMPFLKWQILFLCHVLYAVTLMILIFHPPK